MQQLFRCLWVCFIGLASTNLVIHHTPPLQMHSIDSDLSVIKLVAKLESIEHQLAVLQEDVQEVISENQEIQQQRIVALKETSNMLVKLQEKILAQCDSVGKHLITIGNKQIDRLENVISEMEEAIHDMLLMEIETISIRSCKEVSNKGLGKYILRAHYASVPFVGYCVADKFNGGWLVIQRRMNGSLSFNRTWAEYRNGFGYADGEMWIGLERLYQLTSIQPWELSVEMRSFAGVYKYARYNAFAIGSEEEQYRLRTLGAYQGTAGDSLSYHKGMNFSTWDQDNDVKDEHCAKKWGGGWWFKACYFSFLNGIYHNIFGRDAYKIDWQSFSSLSVGLKYSRIMIRPLMDIEN
ncbi:microfibril-associated glycoprotein 4-like [Anopheles albimanus]|uniref:microfibril-associated glycoprotein 4-like n=1 Tax=Anopheles albimanus TaxID=7167 RepID=UPI0016407E5C|nr:microfibril-associated glycoprotein 4-like [Anopheles albimanus]